MRNMFSFEAAHAVGRSIQGSASAVFWAPFFVLFCNNAVTNPAVKVQDSTGVMTMKAICFAFCCHPLANGSGPCACEGHMARGRVCVIACTLI